MKHKQVKQHKYYKAEGKQVTRLKRVCNRCGDGTFMAEHNDRWYCGKCSMTVWKTKEEAMPAKTKSKTAKEQPKPEQKAKPE